VNKKLIIGSIDKPDGWISIDADVRKRADYRIRISEDTVLDMLDDDSIDLIYSSHLIEHLTDEAVQQLFSEAYRILRKQGGLRVVASDAIYYLYSYMYGKQEAFFKDEYAVGEGRTFYETVKLETGNIDILKPHNLLCTMFCCYTDHPQYCHVFDKEQVEKILKEEGVDAFIEWCSSHYDRTRPGGHCNGFYSEKVIRMMRRVGFRRTYHMGFRKSNFEEFRSSPKLDLRLRKNNSFYVEAIK